MVLEMLRVRTEGWFVVSWVGITTWREKMTVLYTPQSCSLPILKSSALSPSRTSLHGWFSEEQCTYELQG